MTLAGVFDFFVSVIELSYSLILTLNVHNWPSIQIVQHIKNAKAINHKIKTAFWAGINNTR